MLKEFRTFIAQGNVLDLAVGVIIGAAFGKITTSLVEDILNPIIGLILPAGDLAAAKIVLTEAIGDKPEVAIRYGNFLNHILQFLIVAWVIFMIVKAANRMKMSSSLEAK
jgi:large conductance mechanosensitive channel